MTTVFQLQKLRESCKEHEISPKDFGLTIMRGERKIDFPRQRNYWTLLKWLLSKRQVTFKGFSKVFSRSRYEDQREVWLTRKNQKGKTVKYNVVIGSFELYQAGFDGQIEDALIRLSMPIPENLKIRNVYRQSEEITLEREFYFEICKLRLFYGETYVHVSPDLLILIDYDYSSELMYYKMLEKDFPFPEFSGIKIYPGFSNIDFEKGTDYGLILPSGQQIEFLIDENN